MRCTGEPWLLPGMSPHEHVAGSAAVGGQGAAVSWDFRSGGCESPAVQVFFGKVTAQSRALSTQWLLWGCSVGFTKYNTRALPSK